MKEQQKQKTWLCTSNCEKSEIPSGESRNSRKKILPRRKYNFWFVLFFFFFKVDKKLPVIQYIWSLLWTNVIMLLKTRKYQPFKRQPHKMVKYTQTICRQNCQQIVWVCLAILLGWHLKGWKNGGIGTKSSSVKDPSQT